MWHHYRYYKYWKNNKRLLLYRKDRKQRRSAVTRKQGCEREEPQEWGITTINKDTFRGNKYIILIMVMVS